MSRRDYLYIHAPLTSISFHPTRAGVEGMEKGEREEKEKGRKGGKEQGEKEKEGKTDKEKDYSVPK